MFISSMWDVKEPTHYSKRVGREVPGVVAVLCELVKRRRYTSHGTLGPVRISPCISVQNVVGKKNAKTQSWARDKLL